MRLTTVALLASVLAVPAFADAPVEKLKLGKVASGPAHDPKELVGKVVLVEFWGIN